MAYVRSGSSSYRVFVGSKVINKDGSNPLLFTPAQYQAIVGRGFNALTDVVLVMNGDATANNSFLCCANYVSSSGNIGVIFSSGPNGSFRVNYAILAP